MKTLQFSELIFDLFISNSTSFISFPAFRRRKKSLKIKIKINLWIWLVWEVWCWHVAPFLYFKKFYSWKSFLLYFSISIESVKFAEEWICRRIFANSFLQIPTDCLKLNFIYIFHFSIFFENIFDPFRLLVFWKA